MIDAVVSALAWATRFSDPLAWFVIGAFLVATALDLTGRREHARPVAVAGWVAFALFWLSLVQHFAVVQKSVIEGLGSVLAVPLALYVGLLLWRGRDSLFVLSRAIALMGVVFFPIESIPVLRQFLVETVTNQTNALITLLGSDPAVVTGETVVHDGREVFVHDGYIIEGKEYPYENTFVFASEDTVIFYSIIIACTGIGSMAIFAGLILATAAPARRKLRALAVSIPVIYALNLLRNTMIAIGFGEQRFHLFPDLVMSVFSLEDPLKVSYIVIDRIVAQSLSVVALVAVTYLVVRELPEVLLVIEDLLFVVTGTEYDLGAALDVGPATAATAGADGGATDGGHTPETGDGDPSVSADGDD